MVRLIPLKKDDLSVFFFLKKKNINKTQCITQKVLMNIHNVAMELKSYILVVKNVRNFALDTKGKDLGK